MKAKINVVRWPNGYGLEIETDKENFMFTGVSGGGRGEVVKSFNLADHLLRELAEKIQQITNDPLTKNDFGVIATSKLAGVEIAERDYCEGDKKYFTFDEAIEIEKKLNNGWRLPTRKEWTLICEEFACDDKCKLSAKLLIDKLGLGLNGNYASNLNDSGADGGYWSSTINGSSYGYDLLLLSGNGVLSQDYSSKYNGYSIRLVRDIKKVKEEKNERD